MRVVTTALYVLMAVWLLIASALRIWLQLADGDNLDALPFVGAGIGVLSLVVLAPAWDEWRSRNE